MLGKVFQRAPGGGAAECELVSTTLHNYEVFSDIFLPKLDLLVPALRVKEFNDEEIICCKCQDAHHDAFMVLEGAAAITHHLNGMEYVVELTQAGDVFNIEPLVGAGRDNRAARAAGHVELLALDTEMLQRLFKDDPHLGYAFLRTLTRLTLGHLNRQIDRYLVLL